MKRQRHLHKVLTGTLILTVATLVAKILSAAYRIPFQNLVGDTGFYVYQQVYPVYGIGVTLALSGLPVFISKLVAECQTQDEIKVLMQQLLALLYTVAGLLVLLGWLLAPTFAQLMGDKALASVIRSAALMFVFMPILAISRGYWQGKYNMIPTAISQLLEQVVRVSIVIGVALLASHQHWNVYKMGTFAMGSAFVAAFVASLFLFPSIWHTLRPSKTKQLTTAIPWSLIKRLLVEGGVVCLFAGLVVLFQLVDSFTVKRALVSGGLAPANAKSLKGVFDRGQPLIQLGLVVATAFSTTMLPSLTFSRLRRNIIEFRRVYRSALHICIAMSLFAAVGLITLMPQINQLLFVNSAGTLALAVSMSTIILVALISTYSSVLQSLNQFSVTMFGLFSGLVIKLLINFYLVRHFGIVGAALGTIIGLIATLVIVKSALPLQLSRLTMDRQFSVKLVSICSLMGVSAKLICMLGLYVFGTSRIAMIPTVAFSILAGCLVVLILGTRWRLFSAKEMVTFPGGKKILKLINKSHR